jgi:hypothetical protein
VSASLKHYSIYPITDESKPLVLNRRLRANQRFAALLPCRAKKTSV